MNTRIARWVAGTALSAAALWSVSALAADPPPPVPASLTQQGRILDKDGSPLSSKVAITFTIYDDPKASADADVLWTETQNISLDDGYFSAQLGDVTTLPAGIFDGSVRYLGVTVGSDDEMTPRQEITSVPYAMNAGTVPFAGLTGLPDLCGAGLFLKGFAAGAPNCVAPTLSCSVAVSDPVTGTSAQVACGAGQVMTGGGCASNVALTGSYENVCVRLVLTTADQQVPGSVSPAVTIGPISLCQTINGVASGNGEWTCTTGTSATTRAYANCCNIQ
ncbi:MAG TPA: hypothetical protein VGM44_15075 [Polyangiaceae bacterium]